MIDILQRAAREAGEVILKYFKQGIKPSYKTSHKDLVTTADPASQEIIYKTIISQILRKGYKKDEIGFIGEENLNISGKHIFIIDPIDGTTNFGSGIDYFSISIAYSLNKKLLSGLIYNPIKNSLYFAEKNKGAYKVINKNKSVLKIQEKKMKNSMLAGVFNKSPEIYKKEFKIYSRLFPSVRGMRFPGATTLDLCNFVDNIFQIVFNGNAYIWDIAAGKLIVEESKGAMVDWQGKEIVLDFNNPKKPYQFIACHPKLLHEILKFLD